MWDESSRRSAARVLAAVPPGPPRPLGPRAPLLGRVVAERLLEQDALRSVVGVPAGEQTTSIYAHIEGFQWKKPGGGGWNGKQNINSDWTEAAHKCDPLLRTGTVYIDIRATVATRTRPRPHRRPLYTGNGRHKTRPTSTEAATARARDLAPRARGTDASIPSGRAGTDECADAD